MEERHGLDVRLVRFQCIESRHAPVGLILVDAVKAAVKPAALSVHIGIQHNQRQQDAHRYQQHEQRG